MFCNSSASELLGVANNQQTGKRIWELMGPSLYDALRPNILEALTGTTSSQEVTTNGVEPNHLFCQFIPDKKFSCRGGGFIFLVSDRTAQRRLEGREKEIRDQADERRRRADQMLAHATHELRNPINAILGWITAIKGGQLDKEKLPYAVEAIERNAKLQATLISQLLDVSRLTFNKVALHIQPTDLKSVLADAVYSIKPEASTKRLAVSMDLPGEDCGISGDAVRLSQVFGNLLANAVKFTPPGGQVRVQLETLETEFVIRVRDTGIGISGEQLPHVFDQYWQSGSGSGGGSLGIGLYVAQTITELHGGKIDVQSEGLQAGSTFIVRLPK